MDYTYVSDVDDPARIPAFDEIDTALGQNQIRYAIVNRLLAQTGGTSRARPRRSPRSRSRRRTPSTLPADDLRSRPRAPSCSGRRGPSRRSSASPQGGLFHARRAARRTTRIADQVINATVDGRRQLGDRLRQRELVRHPARRRSAPSSLPTRTRSASRAASTLGKYFRFDAAVDLRRADQNLVQEDRVLADVQGLLLHGLSRGPPASTCRRRRATTTAWSSTSRTSARCSTSTARSTRCSGSEGAFRPGFGMIRSQ